MAAAAEPSRWKLHARVAIPVAVLGSAGGGVFLSQLSRTGSFSSGIAAAAGAVIAGVAVAWLILTTALVPFLRTRRQVLVLHAIAFGIVFVSPTLWPALSQGTSSLGDRGFARATRRCFELTSFTPDDSSGGTRIRIDGVFGKSGPEQMTVYLMTRSGFAEKDLTTPFSVSGDGAMSQTIDVPHAADWKTEWYELYVRCANGRMRYSQGFSQERVDRDAQGRILERPLALSLDQ